METISALGVPGQNGTRKSCMIEYERDPSYVSESSFWPPAGMIIIVMVILVSARNSNYDYDVGAENYNYKSGRRQESQV